MELYLNKGNEERPPLKVGRPLIISFNENMYYAHLKQSKYTTSSSLQ